MPKYNYNVSGKVIDHSTKRAIPGLRVQVHHEKLKIKGESVTNRTGEFTIDLELSVVEDRLRKNLEKQLKKNLEEQLKEKGKNPISKKEILLRLRKEMQAKLKKGLEAQLEKVRLDFQVAAFYNEQQLEAVKYKMDWNHKEQTGNILITVDSSEIDSPDEDPQDNDEKKHELHVHGHVSKADETPVSEVIVRAYHKQLRTEKPLGETKTREDGRYEVYAKVPDGAFNLLLRVFDQKETELAESTVLFHATLNESVDIVVSSEKVKVASEFEKIQQFITPYLEGIDPASLSDEEVSFLEQETGLSTEQITHFTLAHRLHKNTKAPLEVLYGTLRIENPTSLSEFLVKDSHTYYEAMQKAMKMNIISDKQDEESLVDHLNEYTVKHILQTPEEGAGTNIGSLAKLTRLTSEQRHAFVKRYIKYKGNSESFWQNLRKHEKIEEKTIKDLQMTMKIGTITAGNIPLTRQLKKQYKTEQFKSLRDLSRLSQNDWLQLIDESVKNDQEIEKGVPESIEGDNEQERRLTYAKVLTRTVEDAYPTAVFTENLRRETEKTSFHKNLLQVLDENKDYELHEISVTQFINQNPEALQNVEDSEGLTNQLKSTRRAFMLAPRFERYTAVKALQNLKLDSASKIASMNQETFVQSFQEKLGGEARTEIIHTTAIQRAGMVQTIVGNQGKEYHQANTMAVPGPETFLEEASDLVVELAPDKGDRLGEILPGVRATWENIFGRMDYCDCEHCSSVYSPAAYLTDILHFLKQRPGTEETKVGHVLEALFERRPDIEQLLLNCENTNTPLPYIDLANEVLEDKVLDISIKQEQEFKSRNTTLTADELRAYPEHIQTEAYNELGDVVYPWGLPFNLYAQEANLYLDHLNIDRYKLMTLLQTDKNDADIHSGSPSVVEIACERLGILPVEHQLITNTHEHSKRPWKLWDFDSKLNWVQTLRMNVPELLARAQLTFKELLALLRTDYINPKGLFGVRFSREESDGQDESSQGDLCNLEEAWFDYRNIASVEDNEMDDLFADMLDRLHRFVRLQRALKWTAFDLDITISTLDEGDDPFSETDTYSFMVRVAHILEVQDQLRVPLEEILSWYGNINTRDDQTKELNEKALYGKLFLNYTVTQPINNRFELSNTGQLNGEDADSSTPQPDLLSEHAETIQAALGISANDFDQLQSDVIDSDKLTLDHLSELHRHVSFARALHVSIPEFLTYAKLINHNPFDVKEIEATKDFIEHVEEVKNSAFSLNDMDGLLQHSGTSDLLDLDKEITDSLNEIRAEINNIHQEHRVSLDVAISELEKTDPDEDSEPLKNEKQRLLSLCQKQSKRFVKEKLAGMVQVDPLVGKVLVEHMEISTTNLPVYQAILESDLALSCEEVFSEDENGDVGSENVPEINRANFTELYDGIVRFKKAAFLVRKMKITGVELPKVLEWSEQGNWLDLNQLPTQESTKSMFKKWLNLKKVLHQQHKHKQSKKPTFIDLLELTFHIDEEQETETARIAFLHHLSDHFRWDNEALTNLTGPTVLDLSFEELGHMDEIERLTQIMSMLSRSSVSVEGLMSLKTANVTEDMARRARFAAKSKYEAKAWLNIAEPIRNILREHQRTALVDYIVSRTPTIQNSNDLLGHFLIDVEMSSCKDTSRITQAISSVQLFVERCLMNLEDVQLSPTDAKEWKEWRKRYRIWEANRKIFLYPENWIEPELRTDKSAFFKDLEDSLMQQDVTIESVEQAYRQYIAKLTEVANLEMAGMCQEKDEETGTEIVHVFARTRNIPRVYYYRQQIKDIWTSWEKLDLEVEGDHLIPIVMNRRLTLFWPIFIDKVVDEVQSDDSTKEPKIYWEIKMAWSNFQDGKWSAIQTTEEGIRTYNQYYPKKRIYFHVNKEEIVVTTKHRFYNSRGSYTDEEVNRIEEHTIGEFNIDYCTNNLTVNAINNLYKEHMRNVWIQPAEDIKWIPYWMGRQNNNSNFHLNYYSLPIDGSRDSNEGKTINKVMLAKKNNYFLLSSPIYNADKDIGDKFFIADQDTKRTFFVKPKDQYGLEKTIDNFEEKVDIDLDKYRMKNDVNHIPMRAHWEDFIAGHRGLGQVNHKRDATQVFGMSTLNNPSRVGEWKQSPIKGFFEKSTILDQNIWLGQKFKIQTFLHPYVCTFNENLIRHGVDGLLDPKQKNPLYRQQLGNDFDFNKIYEPNTEIVSEPKLVTTDVDFSSDGAYSLYNWELFFHIPFAIATRLSQNQRFEDAQKWFHYIFDPTTPTTLIDNAGYRRATSRRFWKIKPFYEEGKNRLEEMLLLINQEVQEETGNSVQSTRLEPLLNQIKQWESNPFDPHTIARLRPVAYMKAVVMKYIDNLIAWGDQLFQQGTRESIDEATHLYVLAAQILGERPQSIPGREVPELSFKDIVDDYVLDALSNVQVEVEDWLPDLPRSVGRRSGESLPIGQTLFYCIPKNEKLMGYWRTVEDRLFKIRHCMNIEGQVQQLPLFAPPIDPSVLVSAAASGADISRAVSDLQSPLPHYRYQVLYRKAVDLCQTVKGLGGALLSALEKQDGEKLSQLRATQQVQLQEAVSQIRTQQITEAEEALVGLERSKVVVEERKDFYTDRDRWNNWEIAHLSLVGAGVTMRGVSQLMMLGAAPLEVLPDVTVGGAGAMGSPLAASTFAGGQKSASAVKSVSASLSQAGSLLESGGQMASVVGGYNRRWEEWEFQANQAEKEIETIDKQIDEANIRLAIVENEKENMDLQIEQAKVEEDYLTDKYTNDQLYNWMVTQVSNLYFQSYELAYSVAKRVEKTYQFELGRYSETFITFGHWDNLNRGLLSGDRLHHELQQMDVAYLNNNRREYELNKDVSLLQLDPYELIRLKETGACEIRLPENLFDQDYPGHYMRRIKTASITIPCISGPYTSVNATLTLVQNKTRISADTSDRQENFQESLGAYHTMATSHASRDGGMFELNFNDERYLPFEGGGADSTWYLELPKDTNRLDFSSISDVLLHLSYTSRDGGPGLKEDATKRRNDILMDDGLTVTYSAKQNLSAPWHEFLEHPNPETNDYEMPVAVLTEGFPTSSGHHIKFDTGEKIVFLMKINEQALRDGQPIDEIKIHVGGKEVELKVGGSSQMESPVGMDNIFSGEIDASEIDPEDWTITLKATDIPDALKLSDDSRQGEVLHKDMIEDMWIICHYALEGSEA